MPPGTDTPAPIDLADFIADLPKCELHVHLEGTLAPELKLQLAERNGIEIGQRTVAEVESTYRFDSLASFLAVYYPASTASTTVPTSLNRSPWWTRSGARGSA